MKWNRHKQAQRSEFKAFWCFWPGICNKTFSQPALKRKPTQAPFAIQPKHRAATHWSPLNVPSAPRFLGCAKSTNTEATGCRWAGNISSAAKHFPEQSNQSTSQHSHPISCCGKWGLVVGRTSQRLLRFFLSLLLGLWLGLQGEAKLFILVLFQQEWGQHWNISPGPSDTGWGLGQSSSRELSCLETAHFCMCCLFLPGTMAA